MPAVIALIAKFSAQIPGLLAVLLPILSRFLGGFKDETKDAIEAVKTATPGSDRAEKLRELRRHLRGTGGMSNNRPETPTKSDILS